MYTITIKNLTDSSETTIYESNDISKFIEKPSLSLEWQQPGSLSFTIIPGHPSYDDIKPIITFVYVYRDDEEIFFGRVLTVDKELFGKKEIYCEGALNFLADGQLLHPCDQTMTVADFMNWCMNEMTGSGSNPDTIEARKQFIIGDIDSSLGSQSAYFKTEEYAEPKSTLDEQLINRFGGCFVIRKETRPGVYSPSGHSISYLKTVGNVTSEKIRICENVQDRTDHDSGESIFTILRPIGANTGGDNDEPCKLSTNGGVIELPAMIAKYGRICKTVNFSDQDTEAGLLAAAQTYITRLGMASDNLPKTCDIKFVDFHYLNPQITTIGFGDVFTDIEGYENQTMVVGHLELDLENPANDSLSLYNQTYLDAREYSALLESSTGVASTKNSSARSSWGGGGSSIAETLAGVAKTADDKTDEINSHFKHVTSETNRELHDNFGIIGVQLDPDTHLPMKDASGNYIWDDSGTGGEIWGHLTRTAWTTVITNHIKDANGKIISLGEVITDAYGNAIINAINDQRTGTATINANRIKLSATDTITLDALLGVEANTNFLTVTGSMRVAGSIYASGANERISATNLVIGSSTGTQGEETGAFSYRGEAFNIQRAFLGYPNSYITLGRILTTSAADLDFNHAHAVSMEEVTTGVNAGKVHAVIGIPVSYNSGNTANRESFFDIAASSTYIAGLAAGRIISANDNIVSGTLTVSSGSPVTLYPGHVIGGVVSKITDYALTITSSGVDFEDIDVAFRYKTDPEDTWYDLQATQRLEATNDILVKVGKAGVGWSSSFEVRVGVEGDTGGTPIGGGGGGGGTCTFAFAYSTIGTQFQVHLDGQSSGLYGVLEYDDGYVYMRDASTGYDYARVYVADLV